VPTLACIRSVQESSCLAAGGSRLACRGTRMVAPLLQNEQGPQIPRRRMPSQLLRHRRKRNLLRQPACRLRGGGLCCGITGAGSMIAHPGQPQSLHPAAEGGPEWLPARMPLDRCLILLGVQTSAGGAHDERFTGAGGR